MSNSSARMALVQGVGHVSDLVPPEVASLAIEVGLAIIPSAGAPRIDVIPPKGLALEWHANGYDIGLVIHEASPTPRRHQCTTPGRPT